MKYIAIIFLCWLSITAVQAQIEITPNGSGATISVSGGNNPYTTQWTDNEGNPLPCANANCDLEDVDPGRYCVTISTSGTQETEECEHDFASVTRCIDIVGSTCLPDLDGEIIMDPEELCIGDNTGTASFEGILPQCLGANVWYEWSNGVTSDYAGHKPSIIDNLGPGTYCLKITENDDNCNPRCVGYFCGTIAGLSEPLVVEGDLTPQIRCWNTGEVRQEGSVSISITGGLGPLQVKWLNAPQSGSTQTGAGPFCVEVRDLCGSVVTKCFHIPKISIICPEDPKEEKEEVAKLSTLKVYPVPTTRQLNVSFESGLAGIVPYQVFNMNGMNLQASSFEVREGENEFSIDVSFLDEGMYLFKVKSLDSQTFIVTK